MANNLKHKQPNRSKPGLSPAAVKEMVELFSAGEWGLLEAKARLATQRYPFEVFGWKALGKVLLRLGKWEPAVNALSRVAKLSPGDADTHNDLGFALYTLDRKSEAEASYRRSLQLDPRGAKAHNNLGSLLSNFGRFDEAAMHLQSSLEIDPNSAETHNKLGNILRDSGRLFDAEASFRHALELDPNNFEACFNLGLTLKDLQQFDKSLDIYRRALELNPASDLTLLQLSGVLDMFGKDEESLACLERSITLNPNSADAYVAMGNLLLRQGEMARSLTMFQRAKVLRPFITTLAMKEKADFSVLLLDAPGPGSTPVTYLIGKAPFDCHFYCVMPDAEQDLELLLAKADVVINMIADADNGKEILPLIQEIVERLDRPTVNSPRLIMNTDRETVARRLSGIPLCLVPRTVRLDGPTLTEAAVNGSLNGFAMPLLVRLAGNHGGDDFEKLADLPAIAEFVSKRPEETYYLTEYVDYSSGDGYFRKYRFICVNGELLPYHLAIHDDWKVHHFRTDMANQAWMRREEEAFLENPTGVFDEARQAALRAMAAASGLDYCGIDCALDPQGRVVVFETNASMLVHDEKDATFTYKNPYIAKIRDAFQARLACLASGNGARQVSFR